MAADGLEWFSAGEKVETCEKGSVAHFVSGGCSLLIIAMPAAGKHVQRRIWRRIHRIVRVQ